MEKLDQQQIMADLILNDIALRTKLDDAELAYAKSRVEKQELLLKLEQQKQALLQARQLLGLAHTEESSPEVGEINEYANLSDDAGDHPKDFRYLEVEVTQAQRLYLGIAATGWFGSAIDEAKDLLLRNLTDRGFSLQDARAIMTLAEARAKVEYFGDRLHD